MQHLAPKEHRPALRFDWSFSCPRHCLVVEQAPEQRLACSRACSDCPKTLEEPAYAGALGLLCQNDSCAVLSMIPGRACWSTSQRQRVLGLRLVIADGVASLGRSLCCCSVLNRGVAPRARPVRGVSALAASSKTALEQHCTTWTAWSDSGVMAVTRLCVGRGVAIMWVREVGPSWSCLRRIGVGAVCSIHD